MSQIPLLLKHSTAKKLHQVQRARGPVGKLAALAALRPEDLQPRIGLLLG
ncbi:MAG TPA: acetyl-CoA C-acyltransferase, partial [Verrucomicrobiales bacterium]|nr:acetyl-CoA C-acyltransferase [Verrucomicrobiales bacterium]